MRRLSSLLFCLALASCTGTSGDSSALDSASQDGAVSNDASSNDNSNGATSTSPTTVSANAAERPTSEGSSPAESTAQATNEQEAEENICESADLQVILALPELGPTGRRLSVSRRVDAFQVVDGFRDGTPLLSISTVEVEHLFDDDEGAHYVWRHLIGELHDKYSLHIPEQNQANIDEAAVVEIQYVHTNAGEIVFETPEAEIIAGYQALTDAVIGDARSDLPGPGLLYTTLGFSVIDPAQAPEIRFEEITIFHGIGHEVRTNPDGSCETDWFSPLTRSFQPLPTEVEVTSRDTWVQVIEGSTASDGLSELSSPYLESPVLNRWLTRMRRVDFETGIVAAASRRTSLAGANGTRLAIEIGVSDDGPIE